jgi:diaminopimelate epimerase
MKLSGSGNDFILIDNRRSLLRGLDLKKFTASICRHRLSVGGDGVILIQKPQSRTASFSWRLFNADGTEAEMSGNGGRCAARFAYLKKIAPSRMTFETPAGPVRAVVRGEGVKIEMPSPKDLRLEMNIPVKGEDYRGSFINTGVPHTVLFVDDPDKVDVVSLGRAIRHHALFQPTGTNVNFAHVENSHRIRMRTYERGVEDETLACGTGAVAVALIAGALGRSASPVTLLPPSGHTLSVEYRWNGRDFSEVFLEGDARVITTGEIWDEAWE